MTSEQDVGLDYVSRIQPPSTPLADMDPRERALYTPPLTGETFRKDNQRAYRLLVELVINTPAWTWIQSYDRTQNGRAAWNALYEHYEGGNQKKKRTVYAMNALEKLYYSNESAFPFERFAAELIQIYEDLKETEEAVTPYKQVTYLLAKFKPEHGRTEVVKEYVRNHHRSDLHGALEYLGIAVAEMFPDPYTGKRPRDKRFINRTRGDGKRRPIMAMNPNTINGRQFINNVDVTNVNRKFSNVEFGQLGPGGRQYIYDHRTPKYTRGDDDGRGQDRQIKATGTGNNNTDDSTLTGSTNPSTPPPVDTVGSKGHSIGKGFGPGAYKNDE